MEAILNILPPTIRQIVNSLSSKDLKELEEIRIRIGRPLELIVRGESQIPRHLITYDDGVRLLNKLTDYSMYALEEELKNGFITITGGHRVGLAGKVVTESGRVKMIRDIASFNIRIAKQKIGAADRLIPYLYDGGWLNTLLIGAPQTGKTTIIRDLARIAGNGDEDRGLPPVKVAIVDERSEIAGCIKGIPQHDVGLRTDILDGCPKAEGMMMLIRSMSPNVLIADEIGKKEDRDALLEAAHAGVKLFITVHGLTIEELKNRPTIKPLLEMGLFDRIVELTRHNGPGTVGRVLDRDGREIMLKKSVMKK